MSDFEKRLAKDLHRGKEYREAYAEAFANEYLATQLQVLRKQRGLTQAQLGERIGSNQGRMSVYEDEEYGRWSLDTLRKIAHELGLWVKVSLESYGTLVAEAAQFEPHKLERNGFEDDLELRRWIEDGELGTWQEKTRRMVARWAMAEQPSLAALANWLQGLGLPEYDARESTPVQHLRESIPPSDRESWDALAGGVARLLPAEEAGIELPPQPNPAICRENLFGLAEALGPRKVVQEALDSIYQRAKAAFDRKLPTGLGLADESGLVRAMIRDQVDKDWREDVWDPYLKQGRHPFLPGGPSMGMRGLLGRPEDKDYWRELARGVRDLERRLLRECIAHVNSPDKIVGELQTVIDVVLDRWAEPAAAQKLMLGSLDLIAGGSWSEYASAAWAAEVDRRGWSRVVQSVESQSERRTIAEVIKLGLVWCREW